MKLTVFERLLLNTILAQHQDGFLNLGLMRKAREDLSFTEDENRIYQPKTENGQAIWRVLDDVGNPIPQEKDIEIGETVTNIIRNELKKLNDAKMLKDDHFTLYEKFVV